MRDQSAGWRGESGSSNSWTRKCAGRPKAKLAIQIHTLAERAGRCCLLSSSLAIESPPDSRSSHLNLDPRASSQAGCGSLGAADWQRARRLPPAVSVASLQVAFSDQCCDQSARRILVAADGLARPIVLLGRRKGRPARMTKGASSEINGWPGQGAAIEAATWMSGKRAASWPASLGQSICKRALRSWSQF